MERKSETQIKQIQKEIKILNERLLGKSEFLDDDANTQVIMDKEKTNMVIVDDQDNATEKENKAPNDMEITLKQKLLAYKQDTKKNY